MNSLSFPAQASPQPVRTGRFSRILHTQTNTSSSSTPVGSLSLTPSSPIDSHIRKSQRFQQVQEHIQQHVQTKNTNTNTDVSTAWISTPIDDPPPLTIAEQNYQQLKQKYNRLCKKLTYLYSDVHLRMYLLGLLRPSDYVVPGSLDQSLQYWLKHHKTSVL